MMITPRSVIASNGAHGIDLFENSFWQAIFGLSRQCLIIIICATWKAYAKMSFRKDVLHRSGVTVSAALELAIRFAATKTVGAYVHVVGLVDGALGDGGLDVGIGRSPVEHNANG